MGGKSSSQSNPRQYTATDEAIISDGPVSQASGDGMVASGQASTANRADNGSMVVSGMFNRVRITDEGATKAALDAMEELSVSVIDQQAELAKRITELQEQAKSADAESASAIQATLADLIARQADLAKQVQSGGETERDKSVLYVVGMALLAAVSITFLFRKKSTA